MDSSCQKRPFYLFMVAVLKRWSRSGYVSALLFCFVSWINLRNMSVNNSTDTHLSIPAVFHHGNPSSTAVSLTLDREVFSTSSDMYTSVKKPLFICSTQKIPPTCFLVQVLVKYVLPHVDCRCNPMEDWTPSIWIEQAGEAVIWLWETQC